jgi:hypothetical protein
MQRINLTVQGVNDLCTRLHVADGWESRDPFAMVEAWLRRVKPGQAPAWRFTEDRDGGLWMALATTDLGRGVVCRGCEGRGWRLALRRRRGSAVGVRRLVRQVCADCSAGSWRSSSGWSRGSAA